MILPAEIRFVNEVLDRGKLNDLVAHCYQWLGNEETTELVDKIKDIGFKYATRSGASIAVSDITVPEAKYTIVADTEAKINEVERQYRRGLLTEEEQYNRMIELWQQATGWWPRRCVAALKATERDGDVGRDEGRFQPDRAAGRYARLDG
jgi:DNA-directed RNA polymerase subunit beta'